MALETDAEERMPHRGRLRMLLGASSGAVGRRREILGFATALVCGPLLSWLMFTFRSPQSITAEVLSYQLLVVVVSLVGGLRPAVFAAVLSGITLDLLFVAPLFSITIDHPLHVLALALYVVIAVLVGLIVDQAARRTRIAQHAAAEAERLAAVATDLRASELEVEALAETDQVRSALLSAVSHDLRRPLASAVAAIGGLRGAHELSASDRDELLATADESLATLSTLVTDLLDVSRVQAGVLGVSSMRMDAAGTVLAAVDELGLGPSDVVLALDPDLPAIQADPVLLQRVIVNVLANAHRYAPEGTQVAIATCAQGGRAEIRVIDHGEGVPAERHDAMFQPFQRYGDTDNTTGLGLGLALSRGFAAGMGGSLTPEDTPGGGLTMVISLPLAAEATEPEAE